MSLNEKIEELKKMRILENEIKAAAISRGSIYELSTLLSITKRIEILQEEINKYNIEQVEQTNTEERPLVLGLVNTN